VADVEAKVIMMTDTPVDANTLEVLAPTATTLMNQACLITQHHPMIKPMSPWNKLVPSKALKTLMQLTTKITHLQNLCLPLGQFTHH
jgi:hypothetical protein